VSYLLKNKLPRNIICTFSLNPQAVIDSEEHFTASLSERIKAAKSLSENGVLVGFHLHPMIYFDGWLDEYSRIADALTGDFSPQSVALVSLGTLTFTKPVLRQIRARAAQSKILQMPLHESCGKYSYPLDIKEQMFGGVYRAFEKWHGKVFFYLCMEDKSLWQKVFGYEYESNEAFEENMKKAYIGKITLFKD
jgi:spore photoproduct lyase